jgi:putative flavoprotein involved in K+ transport
MDGMARGRFDTIVVGGGQAGLAAGYYLKKLRQEFLIIDAHERVGDAWRTRWDSCRLFTPACYNGLPGLPFPARPRAFPTKDEMADYLDSYAARLELPCRLGTTITSLKRDDDSYVLTAQGCEFREAIIIVAVGEDPYIQPYAGDLDPQIRQLHSSEYVRPDQLLDGDTLVVGAGNSGADIALELAPTRRTWLSGNDIAHIPIPPSHLNLYWWLVHHRIVFGTALAKELVNSRGSVLRTVRQLLLQTSETKDARLASAARSPTGGRLVRIRLEDLKEAGVILVPRTCSTVQGLPVLEDGRLLSIANVIWSTGYVPGYSRWIDLPVFNADGSPEHDHGVVRRAPGLYFVGLPFQRTMATDLIIDMPKHTEYVIEQLVRRSSSATLVRA